MDTTRSWESESLFSPGAAGYKSTSRHLSGVVDGPFFTVHSPAEPRDEQGRSPQPKLLRYSSRHACSMLALFRFRGTTFASWVIWLHVLVNFAVAAAVCATVFFTCQHPELIHTGRVDEAVNYAAALVGFLLVIHLVIAVRRWWAMRIKTLGALCGAIGDIALMLAAIFPKQDAADLKALVLRYSLASLELTFMQAQGTDGVLGGLVKQKLLTDDEKRKLEELMSKPQAMWIWIAASFQQLAEHGVLSSRFLALLYNICARARAAVGRGHGAFAYLDTQLPFAYVQLLSVVVHLSNFAMAVKCGAVSAVAIRNLSRPKTQTRTSDTENIYVLLMQAFIIVAVPALYHAALDCAASLANPLGDRFQDLPHRAIQVKIQNECEALTTLGERMPPEALKVISTFETLESDVVQDYVTLANCEGAGGAPFFPPPAAP